MSFMFVFRWFVICKVFILFVVVYVCICFSGVRVWRKLINGYVVIFLFIKCFNVGFFFYDIVVGNLFKLKL